MKIHPGKIAAIIVVIWIYGMGILTSYYSDHFRASRGELTRFYEAKMDSCTILQIDTLDVTNHGGYKVFYTNCDPEYYPIFLQDQGKDEIFRANSSITKESGSLDIIVIDSQKRYDLKIRHPDTQDDREFNAMMFLGAIVVVSILILVAPNSKFQDIGK